MLGENVWSISVEQLRTVGKESDFSHITSPILSLSGPKIKDEREL